MEKGYFTKKELKEMAADLANEVHKYSGCGAYCRNAIYKAFDYIVVCEREMKK